jgi:hypothetical protein
MVLVRIWLISLGFLFIVGFLRFPEKAHKDWSKREISDLSSVIIGTIIEFLPLWVIRLGGVIIGIVIIVVALFFI